MKNTNPGLLGWFVLPSLWLGQTVAMAQDNPYQTTPTNAYQIQMNNAQSQAYGPTMPGSGLLGSPYLGTSSLAATSRPNGIYIPEGPGIPIWGPIVAFPHILYSLTYGNGIEAQPGFNSTTWINTIAPGVLFTLGSHWALDYTPTFAFYSNPSFDNTIDHNVVLRGSTTYGDWNLSLSQSYVDTTQPLLETGTQAEQVAYLTALSAVWQMGSKLSTEYSVSQNFRFTPGFTSLHEWEESDWVNYEFLPQLVAGLGVTGGYNELSLGSDMPFGEINGRVTFRPGTKLSLTVQAGAEDTRFIHPAAPSTINPIFNVSAVYLIRESTTLTLSAARTVTPALYQNELNVTTTVTAALNLPVARNLHFNVAATYMSEPFTSIVPAPLPAGDFGVPPKTDLVLVRSDTRYNIRVGLTETFHTHLTGTIFYMWSDNSSSQANFSYTGNQFGLQAIYRF